MRQGAERVAVVIPAYQPDQALVRLTGTLSASLGAPIVVVDDGSAADRTRIFETVRRVPGLVVLRHPTNTGKGQALKTGFAFVLATMPEVAGVVTADADGQHLPADIARVAARLVRHPDHLVLGRRQLDRHAPCRSRVGNALTRRIFRLLVGRAVHDTQTGLRGVPASLLPDLGRLRSTGYDFELDALVTAARRGVTIDEVPIAAVYEDGNRSSHFDPLRDSAKVYLVFVRFMAASIAAAVAGLEPAAARQLALAQTK